MYKNFRCIYLIQLYKFLILYTEIRLFIILIIVQSWKFFRTQVVKGPQANNSIPVTFLPFGIIQVLVLYHNEYMALMFLKEALIARRELNFQIKVQPVLIFYLHLLISFKMDS